MLNWKLVVNAKNEFIGGPWDGDVTDANQPEIRVKGKHYPHIERVELDYGDDELIELGIVDRNRPERYPIGSYHLRLSHLDGRLRFAYIWAPLVD